MIERTIIVRHCIHKDGYDDEGYCENKIKKYNSIYWAGVADGNGELMCSECMLQCLLYQLSNGGRIPKYEDNWEIDFNAAKAFNKEI